MSTDSSPPAAPVADAVTAHARRAPLAGLGHDELRALLAAHGLSPTHADRLAKDAIRGTATSFGEVKGLGEAGAAKVDALLERRTTRVVARSDSPDGTTKLLVETADGERVEAVLMPLAKRPSGCVSSQVGCGAACTFCASGLEGLTRSLAAHEIVEQVLHLRDEARARGLALGNLVFMGMGEPLHAYDAVVRAIRLLTDTRLLGFGCGHVTVSTVGVVPGILALAEEGLGVNLAVSLHAADDALRRSLLPVGGRHSVAETLDAAESFRVRTRRFVTLQVTLLAGINDRPDHAEALADAIAGRPFHVNLIPVNPISTDPGDGAPDGGSRAEARPRAARPAPAAPYLAPDQAALDAFLAVLARRGVIAHVRSRRGSDVSAACGQLRRARRPA